MSNNVIETSRVLKQLAARNIRSVELPKEGKLVFQGFSRGEITQTDGSKIPNDTAVYSGTVGLVRIPIKELQKMTNDQGNSVLVMEGESSEVPLSMEVISSTIRKDSEGKDVYAPYFYENYQAVRDEFAKTGEWKADKLGALKTNAVPTRDYVVAC